MCVHVVVCVWSCVCVTVGVTVCVRVRVCVGAAYPSLSFFLRVASLVNRSSISCAPSDPKGSRRRKPRGRGVRARGEGDEDLPFCT